MANKKPDPEQKNPASTPPPGVVATASNSGITKEQAKKILTSDLTNMVKKVASGKILATQERLLLQQIADGAGGSPETLLPKWADNQVKLAQMLGVTRKTIQRWLKEPDNPGAAENGKLEVAKWKAYAKSKGHEFPDDDGAGGKASSAKAEQILLQNEKLRDHLFRSREELIPKVMAKQVFSKLLLSAKSRTFTSVSRLVMLARMAPDTATAAVEIQKELTSIWKALEDSKWLK